ncbi:protein of unknown function [Amycolatopsis arida]|uniref:DUF397 domain-containing protein n=1 Tax=Amycolatopsis arida TaxID=587909 RepID=A0A1I5L2F2_9PSEU|nr:DUF397 domain-containing protein [Amycolatopsis arida]TDX93553.1 uncharacterized protein DUF397 [Amycolatopsis arida]SFO91363.1 protein of unknown function [Amycolatopsis arida]
MTIGRTDELTWRKSRHSDGHDHSNCVEVAVTPELIAVRDSKDPDGGRLTLSPTTWRAFTRAV